MTVKVVIAGVASPDGFVAPVDGVLTEFSFETVNGVSEDVSSLHAFFEQALDECGVDHVVLDPLLEPTAAELIHAVSQTARSLSAGDTLVVALSGHGAQINQGAPSQLKLDGLDPATTEVFVARDTYVASEQLRAAWAAVEYDMTLVTIIDCCSSAGIPFVRAFDPREPIVKRHVSGGRSHFSFTAAREGEEALSGEVGRERFGLLSRSVVGAWQAGHHKTYLDWFTEATHRITKSSWQTPVIRYVGPDPTLLKGRPFASSSREIVDPK